MCLRGKRQIELEGRSFVFLAVGLDPAAVVLNDFLADI